MDAEYNIYNDVSIKREAIAEVPEGHIVCVWQGTILADNQVSEFEAWFPTQYDVKECKFLESVLTLPSHINGEEEKGTGGRRDLIFSVKMGGKFPLQRIGTSDIKWLEYMLDKINNEELIYPKYVTKYVK